MRFVSLFAGIGGVDLGLERAGMHCVGQVEIDPYATRVLEKHWPHVPRHGDVRTFRGDEFGPYDLLAGGYPCQPFSVAGNRLGESDERHLWPEVLRIIRHARPRYVLLENVPGHLSLGFGRVLGDLAESGYDAEWDCIPAAAVGAPHRRDRVFILAYPNGCGRVHGQAHEHATDRGVDAQRDARASGEAMADTASDGRGPGRTGRPPSEHPRLRDATSPLADPHKPNGEARRPYAVGATTSAPSLACVRSGIGRRQWGAEPDVGRVADGVPHRVDRLRTLGNAVVPQVAEWIGRRILAAEAVEA